MPKISVITPTRNAALDLSATIESVACQSFTDREFIVVDGGSTDGTVALLQQHGYVIDRWISEPDDGVYDAINKGIDLSTGEWLYFLGAGDELADESVLERVWECGMRNAERGTRPEGSGSPLRFESVERGVHPLFLYGDVIWGESGQRYDGRFSKLKLCRQNICHQAIFYHRSLFDRFGKFDTQYEVCADWAFNLRCFADPVVRPTRLSTVVARFKGGGLSSSVQDEFLANREGLIRGLGWRYWALYRVKQALKFRRRTFPLKPTDGLG